MSGYFADRSEANHLRAVLSNLDSIILQMKPTSPDVRYFRVGKELREIPAADRTQITTRSFYTAQCTKPANTTCDYRESRLDNALRWAAAQPADELSIIISDLFLTAENGNPASPVALAGPLGAILEDGRRSIGILGIQTPFTGQIYDIPNLGNGYVHQAVNNRPSSRPVFALLIGPAKHIERLQNIIRTQVLTGIAPGGLHTALFGGRISHTPQHYSFAQSMTGLRVNGTHKQTPVQMLKVRRDHLDRAGTRATIDVALPPGLTAANLSLGPQQVWMGRPRGSCDQWDAMQSMTANWLDIAGNGRAATLELFNPETGKRRPPGVPTGQVYLMTTDILAQPAIAPQSDWMVQWSFTAEQARQATTSKQPFFKTLNLSVIRQVLDEIHRDAQKPIVVGKISTIISLED